MTLFEFRTRGRGASKIFGVVVVAKGGGWSREDDGSPAAIDAERAGTYLSSKMVETNKTIALGELGLAHASKNLKTVAAAAAASGKTGV